MSLTTTANTSEEFRKVMIDYINVKMNMLGGLCRIASHKTIQKKYNAQIDMLKEVKRDLEEMTINSELTKLPVAWRVKDFADNWILFHDKARADYEVKNMGGAKIEALYNS